uniref:Uncharacterized protein n=1 Tax=Aegilops tauschii subsp. strangulata TaxID=200361 RepID=A0A453B0V6_AEGTS
MRKLWASKLGTPRPLPCSGYEGKATGTVLDDGPAFGLPAVGRLVRVRSWSSAAGHAVRTALPSRRSGSGALAPAGGTLRERRTCSGAAIGARASLARCRRPPRSEAHAAFPRRLDSTETPEPHRTTIFETTPGRPSSEGEGEDFSHRGGSRGWRWGWPEKSASMGWRPGAAKFHG